MFDGSAGNEIHLGKYDRINVYNLCSGKHIQLDHTTLALLLEEIRSIVEMINDPPT